MCPRFWPSDDVKEEAAERRKKIEQDRDIFERAAKLVPNTATGRSCTRLLGEL